MSSFRTLSWSRSLYCRRACAGLNQQEPATLNELLTRATQNNRDLLAVRQRMDEARGFLRQAGVRPAPTLEVGGASGPPARHGW